MPQFCGWHTFRVVDPKLLVRFIHKAQQTRQPGKPILVHCSAGLGRSGVFVIVDASIQKLDAGLIPNPHELLLHARTQRPGLVQKKQQYKMVYESLVAHLRHRQWKVRSARARGAGSGSADGGSGAGAKGGGRVVDGGEESEDE